MQSFVALDILKMLDWKDLASAHQVSKLWAKIIVTNGLWKRLFDMVSSYCNQL